MEIQLDPAVYWLAALFVWSLWGLWIWLDQFGHRKTGERCLGSVLTLFCGPAAWLTAFLAVDAS